MTHPVAEGHTTAVVRDRQEQRSTELLEKLSEGCLSALVVSAFRALFGNPFR